MHVHTLGPCLGRQVRDEAQPDLRLGAGQEQAHGLSHDFPAQDRAPEPGEDLRGARRAGQGSQLNAHPIHDRRP